MKTVLVTGVSKGFGRALVDAFLSADFHVYGLVRSDADALAIDALSDKSVAIVGDVTDESVADSIRACLQDLDVGLDMLVNNAGCGGSITTLTDGLEEEVLRQIQVHCLGALRVTRAALPFLQRSPSGLIINVTSRFGSMSRTAAEHWPDKQISYSYVIAKAAQNMLTLRLAQDLKASRIHICGVHPGRMRTDSGASDAEESASDAAARFVQWVTNRPHSVHGQYFELDSGETGW